jgi:hypothetical protein
MSDDLAMVFSFPASRRLVRGDVEEMNRQPKGKYDRDQERDSWHGKQCLKSSWDELMHVMLPHGLAILSNQPSAGQWASPSNVRPVLIGKIQNNTTLQGQ